MKAFSVIFTLIAVIATIGACTLAPVDTVTQTKPGHLEPELLVSPSSLDFENPSITRELLIMNTGEGILSWTIDKCEEWIECDRACGETSFEQPTVVTVYINSKELPNQENECSGEVLIDSNGGNFTVPVELVIPVELITVMGTAWDLWYIGIEGVEITIYQDEEPMFTVFTGEDGSYIITDVPRTCNGIQAEYDGESTEIYPIPKCTEIPGEQPFAVKNFMFPILP
jgi:hypothetical protein